PFVPLNGEKYDPRGHQLPNPPAVVDENATVGEVLASGFTYQGQLLRRSLVLLDERRPPGPDVALSEREEPHAVETPEETAVFAEPSGVAEPERSVPDQAEQPIVPEMPDRPRQRVPEEPSAQNELPL